MRGKGGMNMSRAIWAIVVVAVMIALAAIVYQKVCGYEVLFWSLPD